MIEICKMPILSVAVVTIKIIGIIMHGIVKD
jgi:hypothetical protein